MRVVRVSESARGGKGGRYLEVGHVGFLVEGGGGQSEGVDNVVDLGFTLLKLLGRVLGGTERWE